jgi:hypothetical protein
MKKIFIEVGANKGQVMKVAMSPKYKFDAIYCLEPVDSFWPALAKIADDRCVIFEFGFYNKNCERLIYAGETTGGTLFQGKVPPPKAGVAKFCWFVDASKWFQEHIPENAHVVMNLNCEGAECIILENLMDSGQIRKLHAVLVDFDVRKFPAMAYQEDIVRRKFEQFPEVKFLLAEEWAVGPDVFTRTTNWLDKVA